jgi:superfamily II DNA/RNA helicase
MIVNYDVPNNTDDYVHRIGRTGRYDKSGIAVTFVSKRDSRTFSQIERIKGNKIKTIDLPQNFGETSGFSWDDDFKKSSQGQNQNRKKQSSKDNSSKPDQSDQRQKRPSSTNGEDEKPKSSKETGKASKSSDSGSKQQSSRSSNKKDQRSNTNDKRNTKDTSTQKSKEQEEQRKKEQAQKEKIAELEKVAIPPSLSKAAERNKNSLKPAKGLWGIIKSFIPKI